MNLRRVTIIASILVLVLASCAKANAPTDDGVASVSSNDAPSAEAAPEQNLSQEEAIEAYNACVTKEGLPEMAIPDLTDSGGGIVTGGIVTIDGDDIEGLDDGAFDESTFDFERFEEVDEKCGHYLETAFGGFEMSPEQEAIMRDIDLAFTKCMKDHGIDMQGMSMFGSGDSLDPEDSGGSPGGNSGMLEFAEGDFEKFEEAVEACEYVFEEAEKQFDAASEGQ